MKAFMPVEVELHHSWSQYTMEVGKFIATTGNQNPAIQPTAHCYTSWSILALYDCECNHSSDSNILDDRMTMRKPERQQGQAFLVMVIPLTYAQKDVLNLVHHSQL
jgi:hypothetical protein